MYVEWIKMTEKDKMTKCNICRVEEQRDQLLSPCNCTNGRSLVHFECVQTLIKQLGTDQCPQCHTTYTNDLIIHKRSGRFERFFHQSEKGSVYAQFEFLFFVMFYLSYFGQFHSRLAYQKGWVSAAVLITIFNFVYLVVHTTLFIIYLGTIIIAFIKWRKINFDYDVQRAMNVQHTTEYSGDKQTINISN